MKFLALCLALVWMAAANAGTILPVSRVVLYRSGVGYIERAGTVDGNTSLVLSLREPQMNDILKSLVLVDRDGGRIEPILYTPRDPLMRTLGSYAIQLGDNPSRATLLNRLRGAAIEVQSTRGAKTKGTILSIETQEVLKGDAKDPQPKSEQFLNLLTSNGVRTIPLDSIASFRLLDERLQKELENALSALGSGLDNTRKSVELRFSGRGQRRVLVGYITEMPVWKMSYRLVIPETGKPLLQGWAIVENTTDEDWQNAQVTLVSGRPVSFIQNLYEPTYLRRPVYQPPQEQMLQPDAPEAALHVAPDGKARLGRMPGVGGLGGEAMGLPSAPPSPMALRAEDMGRSIVEMAKGQELGALFEYRVQTPVSIRRQHSAMLPVINQTVEAEAVSLFNPNRHPQHPLFGVRLNNTSDFTLMEGPVTVYYGDAYGGDALIDTIEPKGERIVTYALDTDVEVSTDLMRQTSQVTSLKIVRGVLQQQVKLQRKSLYTMRNRSNKPRTVHVEQPFDAEWTLVQPTAIPERTRNFYRFKQEVAADTTVSLEVLEERIVSVTYALLDMDAESLKLTARDPRASEALQQALQEIVERRNRVAMLQAERQREEERIKGIEKDQDRIRQNMAQLDRASDLYKQYVLKLTQQESEIAESRARMERIQRQIDEAQQSLTEYIRNLQVD